VPASAIGGSFTSIATSTFNVRRNATVPSSLIAVTLMTYEPLVVNEYDCSTPS